MLLFKIPFYTTRTKKYRLLYYCTMRVHVFTSRNCFQIRSMYWLWFNFYWYRSRIYSLLRRYHDYGLENSSSVVQSGRFLSREFRTHSPVRRCRTTISQLQVQPTPFSIAILALLIYNSPNKSKTLSRKSLLRAQSQKNRRKVWFHLYVIRIILNIINKPNNIK